MSGGITVWPRSSSSLYGAERDASSRRIGLDPAARSAHGFPPYQARYPQRQFHQVLPMFPVYSVTDVPGCTFAQQRADTWIGVVLLLVAFGLQMWNALWPMRWVDLDIHKGAAAYAVVFSVVLGFGAFFLSRDLAVGTEARVKQILEAPRPTPSKTPEKSLGGMGTLK